MDKASRHGLANACTMWRENSPVEINDCRVLDAHIADIST